MASFPARHRLGSSRLACALVVLSALAGCMTQRVANFDAATLADAMAQRPIVLLGEVHDNRTQHELRVAALRRLLAGGARPALAFEQFDRERQGDLDRARTEVLPPGLSRADHLIAQTGGLPGWNWSLYRAYLQLALDHDLPIVAANLSRADAMRVAQHGFGAALDAKLQAAHRLDQLPAHFLAAHERAIDMGHCRLMPPAMLPSLARGQIARDLTLAQAIRPHFGRGVVLLAGNGHVRNDIGVPFFLTAAERARTITIALLEMGGEGETEMHFDVILLTPVQPREDPCASLRKRAGGD